MKHIKVACGHFQIYSVAERSAGQRLVQGLQEWTPPSASSADAPNRYPEDSFVELSPIRMEETVKPTEELCDSGCLNKSSLM